MFLQLIKKDREANDFTCRDGEIDFAFSLPQSRYSIPTPTSGSGFCLTPVGTFPSATLRIPLQSGDKQKADLLLSGEISRVDPASAERITQAILQKSAECLLDTSTDLRRQGLFILPFRFFTQIFLSDGTLSSPSPQAIALPSDFPPHPEITAAQAVDDALTLAIRFPVRPHRLIIPSAEGLSSGEQLRTYISYPLYIPDPKEIRGSLGSVRSAVGGNATGIRFSFLSSSAIKASVAAPEKYYEMVGNERTGYRISSKAAPLPDYSCYAERYGIVPPFPRKSLLALGDGVASDTDPMDWIADWREYGDGYLPLSLPTKFSDADAGNPEEGASWPEGIGKEDILNLASTLNLPYGLLTRPMAFSSDSRSRHNASPRSIRYMHVHGLSDAPALAILYGSNDCRHWTPIRRFAPQRHSLLLTPPRFWWRLLILSQSPIANAAIELS